MPALSQKWWKAYWQLTKSKLPGANGNAALSPCTQAMSGILRRAWRSMPSEPSRPTNFAPGAWPRLAICWLPVPQAMSRSVSLGREDAGIPCISASALCDVVDPSGGDDRRSLALAAVRNDLSETSKIARGHTDAACAPRRAQPVDRDVRAVLRTHRLPDVSAHEVGKSLPCRPLDH